MWWPCISCYVQSKCIENIKLYRLLRSAVGMTHVLRSWLVMDYTTSCFPIDQIHLSIEAQCVSTRLPLGDCHIDTTDKMLFSAHNMTARIHLGETDSETLCHWLATIDSKARLMLLIIWIWKFYVVFRSSFQDTSSIFLRKSSVIKDKLMYM